MPNGCSHPGEGGGDGVYRGCGLFIGTAFAGRPIARLPVALLLVAACFVAVGVARLSLVFVLPVAVPLAFLAARRGWV